MKSGTKSIGERAYATVIAAHTLTYQGVSLAFNARNTAGISDFNLYARSFKLIIRFLNDGDDGGDDVLRVLF